MGRTPETPRVVVKTVFMPDEMEKDIITKSLEALEKYDRHLELAQYLKKYVEDKYQPTWHCIVGDRFSSCVTFEEGYFIHFYIEHTSILLFRTNPDLIPETLPKQDG